MIKLEFQESEMGRQEELKNQILELTKEYYKETFDGQAPFVPGDRVNYAGRCFDEQEMVNLIDSSLEFWLTAGRYSREFEQKLAEYLDVKYCSIVNSGSSANLIAFMALTSYKLGNRRIKRGDEVIAVAAAFPTTVAPIIQFGAIPVFVDVTIPEYNIDVEQLEAAYSGKTKAVMLAHTLGNPFEIQVIKHFCDKHHLWLIEDNCDALGSEYMYEGSMHKTGTIGDIGTSSFYPPHHITMGEGGAVYTNQAELYRIISSLRDWGRDCFCAPGQDGRCGNRYNQQFGQLPVGYDHKYVYSHMGYNLKATDMQAAIGCAQLEKLENFTKLRREHWQILNQLLAGMEPELILPKPCDNSSPSWFGYAITVSEEATFSRDELVDVLEEHNIQTRNLFAGNIIKHPCFDEYRDNDQVYRVVGKLFNTDRVMNRTFWIGVYPEMEKDKLHYMADVIKQFIEERR
jgi:CDP-6-deoxy-D-xylo-4-hexulose-3-dehydrase